MKHIRYLKYVLKHKLFVFIECYKMGILWRGLIHDWSKFRLSEWFPYAEYFYGNGSNEESFGFAWLLHQKRNKHHWQWWILMQDEEEDEIFEMPSKYSLEMIADWKGAGRAITGKDNIIEWYLKNQNKMELHPNTRDLINDIILEKP